MKTFYKLICILTIVIFHGCESYMPAEPDFDNSYPAYVELANTDLITVAEGTSAEFTLTTRTVVYTGYTVTYAISGAYSATGSVDVPSGVKQMDVSLTIPDGIVASDPVAAILTLTGVDNGLALGRTGENLSVEMSITKADS